MNFNFDNIGLNFDNSYSNLPNILMSETNPTPVKLPKLQVFNKKLGEDLNLNFDKLNSSNIAQLFSGNLLPSGSKSIAQAYAGHQFGFFTMLGDGRAILLGEHITKKNKRFDIQLKGSGKTPYSRNGDGRATLTSVLREYLISEAMHGLGVPTTRSLSVISTGEYIRREKDYMGGILTRIASSHIRVGTFQYLSMKGDIDTLKKLVDYCLKRHFSEKNIDINPSITLLKLVLKTQINLIIEWMRIGFIHGVMNTDNMTISGETIDYGPCSFMDYYNPKTVFSSIDTQGRYNFKNQEIICHWNISRFAETLIPLLANTEEKAIELGKKIINEFTSVFNQKWKSMIKNKLGFIGESPEDEFFIKDLFNWMERNKADYTNTFRFLMNNQKELGNVYEKKSFTNLLNQWEKRININSSSKQNYLSLMQSNNPLIIPRNHLVEQALYNASEENNYDSFKTLNEQLQNPYNLDYKNFQIPQSTSYTENYKTFCGT